MRTTKGAARNQAKKRLFKKTKGFRAGNRRLLRTAKESLVRAGVYAFRDRRVRKRLFRELWIIRLNAAVRMRDLRYSQFIHGLHAAGIELDRKSLSEMAIHDPAGFDTIVARVKDALAKLQAAEAGKLLNGAVLMSLDAFLAELDLLALQAATAFAAALDAAALEAARIDFLGAKSGRLKAAQKGLGSVPPADKPAAGKRFNEVKTAIDAAFAAAGQRLEQAGSRAAGETFDISLPGKPLRLGHLHPITQTIEELKDIMGRLGFSVADGPEIEDEWHNFEALNIPKAHPARDPLENFYLAAAQVTTGSATADKSPAPGSASHKPEAPARDNAAEPAGDAAAPLLLRSQTSTVQIRVMEKTEPPVRIISLGRVYRPDTADATHYPMFHQIEGLLIDRHVTMADLKSVLRLFAASYLGADVHIRFRPSFFPFTEPSVEVDMSWHDSGGGLRWVEMGGAGMVDPNVLRAVGYDPEEVSGFAFGLGVERVCARRHGISDIREFYKNDVRFLQQF